MKTIFKVLLCVCALSVSGAAFADCDLDDLVGYTLVAKKTISGRIDDGKREDGYEGCVFGRILVFSDGTGLACADYNYSYSYMPTAYVFSNGSSLKVCVEGDLMSVTRIR